jgi:hypothetical protein
LGDGDEQRRMTQAQILFDIADRAGAFAAGIDPRTGQSVAGLSPAAQLAAATSGLGGQIGQRLGSQEEQDRALRLAALQAAQGEFSAERAAARAAGGRERSLGSLYDIYDAEGNLVQQGVPIANRDEYDALIASVGEGARITPASTDTLSFDTTTLYGPDGSPVTIDTSTSAGVTRARELIDTEGFTTVAPTAGGFDTTTLYSPEGRPVTINTGTAEGRARAEELMTREGFTTVAPTEGGFDTTTLYGPDGRAVTINTATPEGRTEANRLLTTEGFTTVAPTAAEFDTTTLYGPDGRPVTINTGTTEGRAQADDLLRNQGFTAVEPAGGPSGEVINIQMPDGTTQSVRADDPRADALIQQGGRRVSTTAARVPSVLTDPTLMADYAAGTTSPEDTARVQAAIAENTRSVFNTETGRFEQPTITPLVRQAEEARRAADLPTVIAFGDEEAPPAEGAERERVLSELGGAAFGTAPFFAELANSAFALVDANAPFPAQQQGVDAVNALNQDALIAFREVTGGRTAQEAINQFQQILPTPARISGSPSSAASEIEQVINLFNANIQTARESLRTGVASASERQQLEQGILNAEAMVRSYGALLQGVRGGRTGTGTVDPAQFRR